MISEGGVILLVGLDVTDLATIGTLAGCSSGDLIAVDTGRPDVSCACFLMQLLLLFSSLSSGLVFLESFKLLLNSEFLLASIIK
jgi:hypothetical protein